MTLNEMLFLALVLTAFVGFIALALLLAASDALYERQLKQTDALGRTSAAPHPTARHA